MSAGEPPIRNCKNYACACDGSCYDIPTNKIIPNPTIELSAGCIPPGTKVCYASSKFFYMGEGGPKEFEPPVLITT